MTVGLQSLGRHEKLTFKGNLRESRYGWLRLTPAFSVHLVTALVEEHCGPRSFVLDPFCGTGTTALVCAERGIACHTTDINPFLLWLARAKTSRYDAGTLRDFRSAARSVAAALRRTDGKPCWVPPLHRIDRWWEPRTRAALGRAMACIRRKDVAVGGGVCDLLRIAFTRIMIQHANVSFGHQSMSFRPAAPGADEAPIVAAWEQAVAVLERSAASQVLEIPTLVQCDARNLLEKLSPEHYDCVITSPPYPNRMSYIRELRPYMYWFGYLTDGRQAGNLDWEAIGGTWGVATSKLVQWSPDEPIAIPFRGFRALLDRISARSSLLGTYVARYFHDMMKHVTSLVRVVAPAGTVHYIVGNSKFYDVLLPVESLFAAMFESVGFCDVKIRPIRKRSSKKELFEFVVSARRPRGGRVGRP